SIRCCAVVLLLRRRPRSTPFPYTTLFRSDQAQISRFRWPRAVLALSVGFSLTTLAVFALAARDGMAVAALLPDAAYHLGHGANRSEEHTSELQSRENLVCRLLLEKKKHIT